VTAHADLLEREDSILLLVDIQERLFPTIHERQAMETEIVRLGRAAEILGVPVVISEQYPKGLGRTLPSVRNAAPGAGILEKTSFSCAANEALMGTIRGLDRGSVVIAGIEAHICVLQTALDLIRRGYRVHVASDATGSRIPRNHRVGTERAAHGGAVITSVETVLFEWLRRSDATHFKAVQALIKDAKG
jgi:nicotinamidase-related amidase